MEKRAEEGQYLKFFREPHFFEICINVKDLDKTLEQFQSLFDMTPYYSGAPKIRDFYLHGKLVPQTRIKFAYFRAGPVRFELLQPIEGESIWAEFVSKKGNGVQHIGCLVSDHDALRAELKKRGVGISSTFDFPVGKNWLTYTETENLLGTSLELIEQHEPLEQFQYPQKEADFRFLGEPYLFEVSAVVKDLDKSLKKMRSLLRMTPYLVEPAEMKDFYLHGQKVPRAKIKHAYFRVGTMRLQLLQPVEGNCIYMEFLNKKGTCIQHLGCRTSNLDSEVALLEKRGIGVTQVVDFPGGKTVNIDTTEIIGVEFALTQSERIPGE